MPLTKELLSALDLPEDTINDDEEVNTAIVAHLASAVQDSTPRKSLSEMYRVISNYGASSYLDPLNILPLLLPCTDSAAHDIISLVGECSSPKEVIMAIQEASERLRESFEQEDSDDESEKQGHKKNASLVDQLLTIIDLYTTSIPRLKLRRKSASESLRPLFEELECVMKAASGKVNKDQGRSLLSTMANLGNVAGKWVIDVKTSDEDGEACNKILRRLLDETLCSYAQYIQASIAQRTLEDYFPRLRARSSVEPRWNEGDKIVSQFYNTYKSLGSRPPGTPSPAEVILSAHRPSEETSSEAWLSRTIPVLISSFQTNSILDESLAILVRILCNVQKKQPGCSLPTDVSAPLCGVIPTIASAHPNPLVRHQAFRVLSLLLSTSDPQLSFQNLVELTQDSEFPQMRVASVGLVKEGILKALSQPTRKENPFIGSLFLRMFGPILFRPNPPDLLQADNLLLSDFQDTHEPARLTESLSLYYVVLQRDEHNMTGIRDRSMMKTVEGNLLGPLRKHLKRWTNDPTIASNHLHDITPLVSLQISLERVEATHAALT